MRREIFGDRAARRRHLAHRDNRFARATVENVDVTLFRRSDQGRNRCAIRAGQVQQRRLSRDVHIPKIMVDRLPDPAKLTGSDIKRDNGGGEALYCRAAAHSELIGHLVAQRDIDEAEIRIVAEHGPAVGRIRRVEIPRRNGCSLVRVAGIAVPQQCARLNIKRPDHAGLRLRRVVVVYGSPDDDPSSSNDGGRCRIVIARGVVSHAGPEIQLTSVCEARANLPGRCIQCDQPRVGRGQVNARFAGSVRAGCGIFPVGNTAAGLVLAVRI